MKISLIIPTRKRYSQIQRILLELTDCLGSDLELVIGIDEDDESYDIDAITRTNNQIKVVRTPKTKYLSNIYNVLFEYSCGDIVGYFSDDISFVDTSVFDRVRSIFEERGNILYYFSPCSDPYPQCVPDHAFITSKSVRELGFFALPNMEHGYIDHYIGRIYKETRLFYLDSTNPILHLRDKLPEDEVYFEKSYLRDDDGMTCDDRDLIKFNKYCENYLQIHKEIIKSINNKED